MNLPTVLAISDATARGDLPWEVWCERSAESGADALLVRERESSDLLQLQRATSARQRFRGIVLVHRRFDIALASAADGVHLPAAGLPSVAVRGAVGSRLLLGRSAHRLEEVENERDASDYLLFGPVFPSPGKLAPPRRQSLEQLTAACALGVPLVAVGGIDAGNVGAVIRTGVRGVAAIRAFADAGAATELVAAARTAFAEHRYLRESPS